MKVHLVQNWIAAMNESTILARLRKITLPDRPVGQKHSISGSIHDSTIHDKRSGNNSMILRKTWKAGVTITLVRFRTAVALSHLCGNNNQLTPCMEEAHKSLRAVNQQSAQNKLAGFLRDLFGCQLSERVEPA